MVALTVGAVACALAGDAGGCLQGGPSTGVFPYGFEPGGGTGPLCGTLITDVTSNVWKFILYFLFLWIVTKLNLKIKLNGFKVGT